MEELLCILPLTSRDKWYSMMIGILLDWVILKLYPICIVSILAARYVWSPSHRPSWLTGTWWLTRISKTTHAAFAGKPFRRPRKSSKLIWSCTMKRMSSTLIVASFAAKGLPRGPTSTLTYEYTRGTNRTRKFHTVVTHSLGRKNHIRTPFFLIFFSLSHILVKPETLYYSKN